jgi:hypothetical protein
MFFTDGLITGQIPAGLAHKPDRDFLVSALEGLQKKWFGHHNLPD